MTRFGLVCLLLAAMAWGQAATPTPTLSTRPSGSPAANPADTKEAEASNVPPDTPVITINGACPNPPPDKAADQNCKTVITRAEFEKIMDALRKRASNG
jgi:Ni,Fe-hydrogenase I small subunit